MNKDTTNAILGMIRDHDSQWGWYQIDRALALAGILGVNVSTVITALVEADLVVGDGDPC